MYGCWQSSKGRHNVSFDWAVPLEDIKSEYQKGSLTANNNLHVDADRKIKQLG